MATTSALRFLHWLSENGIEISDALELRLCGEGVVSGAGVVALRDLREGELVASIPKKACLTTITSGASAALEEAELGGGLGLAIALMYERSRGSKSPWFAYLGTLPEKEMVPFVWSDEEIDRLLVGTELHKVIKQDRQFMKEDWEEHIVPLAREDPAKFPSEYFSLECYLAAKSLIASRSFEIDEYHGHGMVPLADLFNHKTAAEDVHFMSNIEEESEDFSDSESDHEDPQGVFGMLMVKDVARGSEIFNTYGQLSNAALLHRYGFTEPNNPYDIVNIDLTCIKDVLSTWLSSERISKREKLWRKAGFSACESQGSEYFEVEHKGKPDLELLVLLFLMRCSATRCKALDKIAREVKGDVKKTLEALTGTKVIGEGIGDGVREWLLSPFVVKMLVLAVKNRDQQYGSRLRDDKRIWKQKKLAGQELHAMSLRISERSLLRRCLNRLKKYISTKKKGGASCTH